MNFKQILEKQTISASVPCRIDLGGTLDISTFFLPLLHLGPATFNIALDLRTCVTLSPWQEGRVRVSSRGFEAAEFSASSAPYNHPMGLMFAVADYFNAQGVHISIDSASPPRSALGGSSSAATAIMSAFLAAAGRKVVPGEVAVAVHFIESAVAGVPCGFQDQLAAAFGGVNQWCWTLGPKGADFKREILFNPDESGRDLNRNILVAYCGSVHVSKDINKRWVEQFLFGKNRDKWKEIIRITRAFSQAVKKGDFSMAAVLMNQETDIRLDMTPDVLDGMGQKLFDRAKALGCGARFTGAGGGGCVWAIGESGSLALLKEAWGTLIKDKDQAALLDAAIDYKGIIIN